MTAHRAFGLLAVSAMLSFLLGLAACGGGGTYGGGSGGGGGYGMPTGAAASKLFAADAGYPGIGSLVNPDPAALAEMAIRVPSDDELGRSLVAEAYEHLRRFDWGDVAEQTAGVYADLVGETSPA